MKKGRNPLWIQKIIANELQRYKIINNNIFLEFFFADLYQ